jgi:glycosyltransferase involved in cell wall biosynthesis
MACAKPLLLMVGGEARAIVDEARAGLFVTPGDPGALCAAIGELKAHPERGRAMGIAGRQYVMQHYRRSDQARRFATLVSDIASRRGAIAPGRYKAARGCAE